MAVTVNFNAQLAPVEHIEKIMRPEQDHAQISGQALLSDASRLLGKENEQVAKAEKSNERRVDQQSEEGGKRSRSGAKHGGDRDNAEEDREEAGPAPESELGNIVNLKV